MRGWFRCGAGALLSGLMAMGLGCAAEIPLEQGGEVDDEIAVTRQGFVESINGMQTINGLRSRNGLISINGLSITNGLRSRNGLITINGLVTRDGASRLDGLTVDCTAGRAGATCSGTPDGLLNNVTGMMASDDGIATATYVIRCALPADDAIRIADYTGALVTLRGELGLAPEWKTGSCDRTCQERVSACLMAFTNGDGENVDIEVSAHFTLGTGHSEAFPYQEAVFYGNLFSDPPQAYYCVGADYATSDRRGGHETRACEGYNERDGECPYVRTGVCNTNLRSRTIGLCAFSDETATRCASESASSRRGFGLTVWQNPITTFRSEIR